MSREHDGFAREEKERGTNHSHHVGANGKTTRVERNWHPEHIAAGYHVQDHGAHATPDSDLIGTYETGFTRTTVDGEVPITVTVSFLQNGLTGPEFLLEWSDGLKMQVLDDATAVRYLLDSGVTVAP